MSTTPGVRVIIDDQIRDERFTQFLETGWPVREVIDRLVTQYGLPRYDLTGERLHYDLIRSQTGQKLAHETTLAQAGVREGEELQLVSPEARRIWGLIQALRREVEQYLKNKAKELARQKLKELQEALKKTKANEPQAERLAQQLAGRSGCLSGFSLTALAVAGVVLLVALLILILVLGPGGPSGGDCRCDGPDLVCEDGSFQPGAPECRDEGGGDEGGGGGPVDCQCDGPDLVCEDGGFFPGHPECEQEFRTE